MCMKENENIYPHTDVYTHIHGRIIYNSQKWKYPRCPLTGEWINKLYIHTVEYNIEIKINKVLIHATKWTHVK